MAAADGFGAEAAGAEPAAAPNANLTIGLRAVTAAPSSTRKASMTPAFGALTSIAVLSVSMLAISSSSLTASPTCFKNVMFPSLTDSANSGELITIVSTNHLQRKQQQENVQKISQKLIIFNRMREIFKINKRKI